MHNQPHTAARRLAVVIPALLFLCFTLEARAAALELVPVGRTVGITLQTGGLLVSQITEVQTGSETFFPAQDAGLMPGDLITSVNGIETPNADVFLNVVADTTEDTLLLQIERCGEMLSIEVRPAISADGEKRLGLWLRDGITGIGTLTFADPETGAFGALGHSICDMESGTLVPMREGKLMRAEIIDVLPGASGVPGELCGSFDETQVLGAIERNTQAGIFGTLTSDCTDFGKAVPVASAEEIEVGPATILANVNGSAVKAFDVQITKKSITEDHSRSLSLEITDSNLLAATGGIVQGMSGSPILQNGKLVGAVTHVLVGDPTRGYGITIEEMLLQSNADILSEDAA